MYYFLEVLQCQMSMICLICTCYVFKVQFTSSGIKLYPTRMAMKQIFARRPRIGSSMASVMSTRHYVGLPDEVQMLKDMCRTFADQVIIC